MKSKLFLLLLSLTYFSVNGQIGFRDHIITDNSRTVNNARSVRAADIDGDGDIDVLSVSADDHKVAWYENTDGQGNFSVQRIIATDALGAESIFPADIDGDGDIDVLCGASTITEDKVIWYENLDGLGNFGPEQILTTSALDVESVYASDLDGDGDLDALSASREDHKIAWYENTDGQGNFGTEQIISVNTINANSVNAADLDGDGDMDVVSASWGDDKIAWYENTDGQGNFGPQQIISINSDGALFVDVSDVDGDGDMDVLSASILDDKIAWYENTDGQGNFSTQQIISTSAVEPVAVHASDVDGDGDMDVLSASWEDSKIAWYENIDGQGNFGAQQIINATLNIPQSVYTADLDGDGDMDVMSASQFDDEVNWYENTDGLGTFDGKEVITTNITNGASSIYASDLDGDGDVDILSASKFDHKVAWYENTDGLGTFGKQQVITTNANGATFVYASDLDGDGDMDVLSASAGDDKIAWYENTDGQGDFGPQKIIATNVNTASTVYAGDIDNDGDMDVVSAAASFGLSNKITWYTNIDGQGTFGSEFIIPSMTNAVYSIELGDVDGDGDLDILSAYDGGTNDKVAWYENTDGVGMFSSEKIILANISGTNSVHANDLDDDGDLDVLYTSTLDNKVAWLENTDGLGTFGPERVITTNAVIAYSVYSGDIDNDGDLDVLSASANDNKIAWYENLDGLGDYGSPQTISDNARGRNVVFAIDIDGDTDLDVLSASETDSKIAWYENLYISSNEITGYVILDLNSNGCDSLDLPMQNLMVETSNGTDRFATFTLSNSFYQLFPETGDFTTVIGSSLPNYYSANPESHLSSFTGIGSMDTADFCIIPNQVISDLNISMFPTSEARPGFIADYQIVYRNVGTTILTGTVVLEFDNSKLNFLSASETVASQAGNTIIFDYSDLNPFETRTIDLRFLVFAPPIVNIDEQLSFVTSVEPIAGDGTVEDNVFTFDQTVIGSFAPNDIHVLEGDEILIEDIGNYLHYIIRFQNTGTASAINVRVDNTLDANLNWNTLQLESTSHSNQIEIKDGNEVSFIFEGINLPDSTSNEPESHGFIAYKIKPKSDIAIGDSISNKADIFFDFNKAVETNTVVTKVVNPTSIHELTTLNFTVYPIPTNDMLAINAKTSITRIEIFNRLGQLVLANSNKSEIDVSTLNQGLYFCRVKDENGDTGIKKVVKQ